MTLIRGAPSASEVRYPSLPKQNGFADDAGRLAKTFTSSAPTNPRLWLQCRVEAPFLTGHYYRQMAYWTLMQEAGGQEATRQQR